MEPNRQSIRMRGWDYTRAGYYFVTINTYEGRALFGVIVNGRMVLNEAGRIAEEEWHKSAVVRKGIELDEFVVMPNHVHGIVRIQGLDASSPCRPQRPQFGKPIAGALGTFVGAYKAAVSREINRRGLVNQAGLEGHSLWHRNYWDVIVRDEAALANIRRYIRNNPRNYEAVRYCGKPRLWGNTELLNLPKMGFLASRGETSPHGQLATKSGEAIISGFLSPMERMVFTAGLTQKRPLIWVKPWGFGTPDRIEQEALDAGRLLIVSPFADNIDEPSVQRAAWCNEYVLAHCDRLVVGHLNPSGMLACILSEKPPDLEITFLQAD